MKDKLKMFLIKELRSLLYAAVGVVIVFIAIAITTFICRQAGLEVEYKPSFKTLIFGLSYIFILTEQMDYRRRLKKLKKELEK